MCSTWTAQPATAILRSGLGQVPAAVGSTCIRPASPDLLVIWQGSAEEDAGNGLAILGVWRLGKLQRSLALMMLTWATRLQDPVLSSQVSPWLAEPLRATLYSTGPAGHHWRPRS